MRLPKPLLDFIDHSLALSGRPFEPDTSLAPPHGRYATVHYGIMLPGLPAPHHFLNLVAVVLAIWNAFVHSRDAYAVAVPGTILSALTVALIALGLILLSLQPPVLQGGRHG